MGTKQCTCILQTTIELPVCLIFSQWSCYVVLSEISITWCIVKWPLPSWTNFLIYMSLGLSVKFFLSTENFQSPTGKDLKIIDPMGICSSQSTISGQKCPLPLGHQLIGAHIEYLNSVCKLRIKNQRRCVFCYNSDDRLLWSSSWCHSPECSD